MSLIKGIFLASIGIAVSALVLKHFHSVYVDGAKSEEDRAESGTNGQSETKCSRFTVQRVAALDNSYYPKEHKEHLVRDFFDARPCEWKVVQYGRVHEADLAWVFSPHQLNYAVIKSKRVLTNHVQNLHLIVEKDEMFHSLKTAELNKLLTLPLDQIVPKTYVLQLDKTKAGQQNDLDDFLKYASQGIWISKLTNQFGGHGIEVVKDLKAFKARLQKMRGRVQQKIVVQKYIENPLLIEGRKFDIRSYIMLLDSEVYLAFYHPGFVRRSLYEYKMEVNSQNDDYIHLTNLEAQKQHPRFEQLKDQTLMTMDLFHRYLSDTYQRTPEQIEDVKEQIKILSTNILLAMRARVGGARGQFQILGCDFMIDDAWKVWLIEVNKSPSWQILHESQNFKKEMLHTYMAAVLRYQDDYDKLSSYEAKRQRFLNETLLREDSGTHFELLMDGWSDYYYGKINKKRKDDDEL